MNSVMKMPEKELIEIHSLEIDLKCCFAGQTPQWSCTARGQNSKCETRLAQIPFHTQATVLHREGMMCIIVEPLSKALNPQLLTCMKNKAHEMT